MSDVFQGEDGRTWTCHYKGGDFAVGDKLNITEAEVVEIRDDDKNTVVLLTNEGFQVVLRDQKQRPQHSIVVGNKNDGPAPVGWGEEGGG